MSEDPISQTLVQPVEDYAAEVARARALAERYRVGFVDMDTFRIDQELFRTIPADLMLRYGFVPLRRDGRSLVIVVSDPTDLPMIDELGTVLSTAVTVMVGAPSAIQSILKKSESSQRVLEEATEGFQLQVLQEDDNGEEHLTVDKLTSDVSPVIRLVDSTIFTAIQRRASDIHIETGDDSVHVKYRIDGVLQPAMRPIAKQFHSPIISRIKVMAELDIAEKRIPQDGRFKGRPSTFVSPSCPACMERMRSSVSWTRSRSASSLRSSHSIFWVFLNWSCVVFESTSASRTAWCW